MKNLNLFKKISIAEGVSFILLMGVAMPLKYMMDMPLAVKYTGWAHGVLFIFYIIWLFLAADEQSWKWWKSAIAFVAALLPFGPFVLHWWLEKEEKKEAALKS